MNELEQKDSQLETKLSELQSREVLKRILELEPGTQKEESNLQSLQQESLPYNIPILTRSPGKSGNPRTCKEIHSNDPSSPSGMYWIDPDGQGVGDDSIYVHCDMTTGTTSVPHDSESPTNVGHCTEPGCYSRTIRYNATSKQMSALAELSVECHQSIVVSRFLLYSYYRHRNNAKIDFQMSNVQSQYDCNYAPFEFNNVPYAWWNDRNGDPHYYWAGSATDVHSCQCSIDQNCVDGTAKCNCDSISPTQLTDAGNKMLEFLQLKIDSFIELWYHFQGFITDKKLLPVTGLNFGRTQFEISSGVHTLSRFQCSGQVTISGIPKSCEDLWRIGHSLNGVYSIVGSAMMESVYCDFTKLPEDPGFQKWIGYADVKSVPTYFYVQRSDRFSKVNVSIPFDVALVNIGNAMNLTTGVFTAPRAGTYYFSFTGLAEFPTFSSLLYLGVDLYLNGNLIGRGFVEDQNTVAGQFTPVTLHSTLNLLPGDQIWLQMDSLLPPLIGDGTVARRKKRMLPTKGVILFDDYRHFTHFTGLMLEEDISQSL
ncbi:neurexin IV [Daphnia pulex]|uniref:Neurexin IV n=1 Tax=Daphnia pulex TaxID=6669 RepID=E9HNB9_DAPPU|nr:neurexin IV [Daphnia pulex]|eukprot:EFX66774.1 neurexin IV [Daphnia pulex]